MAIPKSDLDMSSPDGKGEDSSDALDLNKKVSKTYGDLNKKREDDGSLPPLAVKVRDNQAGAEKRNQETDEPEEEDDSKPREKVVEKVIIREKERKGGGIGCSCRSCTCFGCLGIILLIVLFGSILYFRPTIIWDYVKSFMNDGYEPTVYERVQVSEIRQDVLESLETDQSVELTEQQLQSLLGDKLKSERYTVDVEPNYLRINRNVDSGSDEPLWLILEIGYGTDDNVKLTNLGFQRVGVPEFLRDRLANTTFSTLDLAGLEGTNEAVQFMNVLLEPGEEDPSAGFVRFDKDKVTIRPN